MANESSVAMGRRDDGETIGHETSDDRLDAAYRLQLAITRVARMLRQEVHTELTPSQISALSTIRRSGPMSLGELAEAERVAPPSVTRMVDRLEAAGYVQRMADAEDRRVCHVVVTDRAEVMVAQARERKAEWLARQMDELQDSERAALLGAVDAIEALAATW